MLGQIPIISTRTPHVQRYQQVLDGTGMASDQQQPALSDVTSAIDYLAVELPKLCLLDADDPNLDTTALLRAMIQDSWLLQTGVILVYENWNSAQKLQDLPGGNVLLSIEYDNLERDLPRVLQLSQDNLPLFFQRGLGEQLLDHLSAQFSLSNDPLIARCLINLVCNCLYQAGRLDQASRSQLQLALVELILNAIQHGNCEISSQDKTDWLEAGHDIAELITQRCEHPHIAQRRVHFEYTLFPDHAQFLIRDEGSGFDWRSTMAPSDDPETLLSLHGRGLQMAEMAADTLKFNEAGNEVRFRLHYPQTSANPLPGLCDELPCHDYQTGDLVFQEGEQGDDLYFISSGRYAVQVDGQTVAELDHQDIVMGEMSFLLNGRRNANVVTLEPGRLTAISRREWVKGLRQYPHYGLFLSRLLAQRLDKRNRQP